MIRSLAIATALLLAAGHLPAQGGGPAGCTFPNHIEIGVPAQGGSGTDWLCPPIGSLAEGKIRIHGDEGAWAQVLVQVSLRNTDPNDPVRVQLEAQLLSQFPWLAPVPEWYLHDILGPTYGGQPGIRIAPTTFWSNVFLPVQNLLPDDVKKFYQPIVLNTGSTRIWKAGCPVWDANPIIQNPPTTMSVVWKDMTADFFHDVETFDFHSMMQFAALIQGGADALPFLNQGTNLQDAIFVGLHLQIQAILLKSGDPGATVTNDETTTDGLTGLDSLVLPELYVTSGVEITISQGIPLGGNPEGPTVIPNTPTHHLQLGSWNMIPVRRFVPPAGIRVHLPNVPPFILPLRFLGPGRVKVFVPGGMPTGLGWFDLVSPYGDRPGSLSANWSLLNFTTEPLNPLNPGYSVTPPSSGP